MSWFDTLKPGSGSFPNKIPSPFSLRGKSGPSGPIGPSGDTTVVQNITNIVPVTLTSSGTESYVGTGSPTQTGYNTTTFYVFTANFTNRSGYTVSLKVDGLATVILYTLVNGVKTLPVPGTFVNGDTYTIYFDGVDFIVQTGKIYVFFDQNGEAIFIGQNGQMIFLISPALFSPNQSSPNLLVLGQNNQVNQFQPSFKYTYIVDLNGNDNQGNVAPNPIYPFLGINTGGSGPGLNNYLVPGTSLIINAGNYTPNINYQVFKTLVYYFLNWGVTINQTIYSALVSPNANETILIKGYGKLVGNGSNVLYIQYPCTIDVEFNEWYDNFNGATAFAYINTSAVNGNIRVKKAWRNPANTATSTAFFPIILTGACELNIYIDELNVPLTQQALAITVSGGAIVNFYAKRVFGNVILIANGGTIRYQVEEETKASIVQGAVQAQTGSGGVIILKGNMLNTSSVANSYGLFANNTAGLILLLGNAVINTAATISIENGASPGVLQIVGKASGNGTISTPIPLATQTSGSLVIGMAYIITTFVSGDSFTNVGSASNATGVSFIASGTTPTNWTNGSTLSYVIGEYIQNPLLSGI